uniref:Uncharacterized protein n=1 Tax=Siphoviridae sp. ct1Eo1 TaxID=2825307 RepID=A0A8S5P621_9CAUD|nr:MAG TPA: hypothetical protein [Siphoviridae sp. ct1Eo1]
MSPSSVFCNRIDRILSLSRLLPISFNSNPFMDAML